VHQRWVATEQGGGVEPALFEFAGAGVADDNVCSLDQPAEFGGGADLGLVNGRQQLAAVPAQLAGVPRAARFARRYDAHHLGAEIGKEHPRGLTGDALGQFEDAYAEQRSLC
jgi:hypothetical protein